MNDPWPVIISIHTVSASLALILGAFQLLSKPKGTKSHRFIGRFWVLCMYVVTVSSFWVQTLNGGFTWLHGLSVLTFITVTIGVVAAVRGKIKSHKSFMQGSYYGILGAFIGVIAVPTRRIPQMALLDPPMLIMWVAVLLTVSLSVIGFAQLYQKPKN